ncbi:MAG: metal ABC transporter ATP-binding protein [Patescibacteria group bacterium]
MNVLKIRGLSVTLGSQHILDNVSFDVEEGEITAVIGPNGSGKSTLFRAILGLVPYTGKVSVFGKPTAQALERVGYIPQHFDFDRTIPITVKEFLAFTKPELSPEEAEKLCHEVRVDALEDKLIGELSGGQLQRVLIAQTLFKDPKLILLDEPASGIDIEGARAFYDLIEHLNKKHKVTVMLISHEISFVHGFAHKVICLNRNLVCDGVPAKVLDRDTMQKLYGSRVDMHFH